MNRVGQNLFCKRSDLKNEADVETWFLNKLLAHLSYDPEDINLKTSLKEYKIGKGSKSSFYKPDYVIVVDKFPILVIDAKSPDENIENWTSQCSSYCLELNKGYEHNPVEYYLISNGISTSLYKWDKSNPLISLNFEDFIEGNAKCADLIKYISKFNLKQLSVEKHESLMEKNFPFHPVALDEISTVFSKLHELIWKTEKKTPSAAFKELIKIIFIKIKKDKELHERLGPLKTPKYKDVVFSVAWIKSQTENDNPINDPLFKNLKLDLEREIKKKNKKRIFDSTEDINLHPSTIEKIVSYLENIDFYTMDEDIHGRMFEIFLDATVRGKELGQYFTPRDIVKLMVKLANIEVSVNKVENVLDACCGSAGFLISAMSEMLERLNNLVGLSNKEKNEIKKKILENSIVGIDAGSEPPIYRIARMNMYLHGDGGSNIYLADSLNKKFGQVGRSSLEIDDEILELRDMILTNGKKFDVILSNPPFSMKYSRDNKEQKEILDQYTISRNNTGNNSLLSSVMFLERYKDLVSSNGRILAIIDDSVLSGDKYIFVRNYLREKFIIRGIISLPGDAFKRANARVKTSILILRTKTEGEIQSDVFMQKSVYLGLTEKVAKRIGIGKEELEKGKNNEIKNIVDGFNKFSKGERVEFVVDSSSISDRLDVKYCLNDNGRLKPHWENMGLVVKSLEDELSPVDDRKTEVESDEQYTLLKVTYEGEVLEAETKEESDISYSYLYKVHEWDILYSNMGVGRGAIGIVPEYYDGKYVSNEYTILRAKSKAEAVYYTNLLRTKEILGDILSSSTGMNRGRIKWEDISSIEVPVYSNKLHHLEETVDLLTSLWDTYSNYHGKKATLVDNIASNLKLNDETARLRWLAYKPPE